LTARDVFSRDVVTVTPSTSIWTALATMRNHEIRHLVVVQESGELAGILSNRDYRTVLNGADAEGVIHGLREISVGAIMTRAPAVLTTRLDTPLVEIAELMVSKKIGSVPVVDDRQRPIGILTWEDVLRGLLRQQGQRGETTP
jgi:acetoin utilization protein AcuB